MFSKPFPLHVAEEACFWLSLVFPLHFPRKYFLRIYYVVIHAQPISPLLPGTFKSDLSSLTSATTTNSSLSFTSRSHLHWFQLFSFYYASGRRLIYNSWDTPHKWLNNLFRFFLSPRVCDYLLVNSVYSETLAFLLSISTAT